MDGFVHGFGLVVHQMEFESFGERLLDFVHALDDALGNLHHVCVGTFLDIERDRILTVEAGCGCHGFDGVLDHRDFAKLNHALRRRNIHVADFVKVTEFARGTYGGVLVLADDFTDRVIDVRLSEQAHDGRDVHIAVNHLVLVEFDGNLAGRTTEDVDASHAGHGCKERLDIVFDLLTKFGRVQRTRKRNGHDGSTVDVHLCDNRSLHGVGEVHRREVDLGTHVVCRHVHVHAHVEHGDDDAVVLKADGLHVVDTIHQFHLVFERLDNRRFDFFRVCALVDDGRGDHGDVEFRHQVHHHHGIGIKTEHHHGQNDHEHGYRFIDTGFNHSAKSPIQPPAPCRRRSCGTGLRP